jgi:cysteine desulfurase
MSEAEIIYLDHAAATPLLPEAAAAMADAYRDAPGNPSAIGQPGRAASRLLRHARERLARVVGVHPERLLFTSGGTESIGLAVLGTLRGRDSGHVITSAIEHPAVLGSVRMLEQRGFEVTRVRPDRTGVVDPERFADAARSDTVLACLMHVNNELGTIQPVEAALGRVKERAPRCLTLVDAVQSFTRLDLAPDRWQADLVALSGHKVGGPRGVGALVTGKRRPERLFGGGDQEWGARPGTQNVPGIVGFAAAAEHGERSRSARLAQVTEIAAAFGETLGELVPGAQRNGRADLCLPWIVSVSVAGLPSEALLRGMEEHGVCVSAGAACFARSQKQSHVLQAIGVAPRMGTMRVSFGEQNTPDDARRAAEALALTVKKYALP